MAHANRRGAAEQAPSGGESGRGWSNEAIGSALYISPHTVRTHVQNILEKLEMHSRLEAATFAMECTSELPATV